MPSPTQESASKVIADGCRSIASVSGVMTSTAETDQQNDSTSPMQAEEADWNPLNMRILMLQNLANSKNLSRSAEIQLTKNKKDCGYGAAKTLDLLRRLVQDSINAELSSVIEKYLRKFFDPAVANIRKNREEVSDEHISYLCQQMLEEAKRMYVYQTTADNLPASPLTDSEVINRQRVVVNKHIPSELRKPFYRDALVTDSDAESDVSVPLLSTRPRKRPKHFSDFCTLRPPSRSSTPGLTSSRVPELSPEDLVKWNPCRIEPATKFVLGSKANKALGMGAQRGKIYMKHSGLFRYIGDNDDKSWLHKQGLKSMKCGGRAFFLLLEDVLELANSDEYKDNPDNSVAQLHSFAVPEFILKKMKSRMSEVYELRRSQLIVDQNPNIPEKPSCDY